MNLASSDINIDLSNFMNNFDYKNFVNEYTRVVKKFYKNKDKYITSKTIIDVVLHNKDLILS